ncbi:glycoside hydrolase family 13 protein [Microbacterium sp. G2-8]|uniref:glycoside hydrolase family 13 protein n=1 Tax=Microbacterium sp. G2-8 TaxID=2842454 RepID=UPI001C8993E4|nr:glycoside hydrolase family 13 protein [Microbacterium sp. G2-8]
MALGDEWWREAVIYQIYPRSFADANGDGVGDLPGALTRIDDLADLGVDAIWFSPFMRSPQRDAGYDVADYRDIDPLFGTLVDFDAFLAAAHERGIRVIVDLVPNHSSVAHAWFQEALAAGPGSAARERYLFLDGRGSDGELPPNNWESEFGGSAWERITEPDGSAGQWYLHLFDSSQPDFNWRNPEVRAEFLDILRFWLDRGVDGFRVDVAHGLIKKEEMGDHQKPSNSGPMGSRDDLSPYRGQPEVHDIFREWHQVMAEYEGDRVLCAEAWLSTADKTALWVRRDEMHQAFNFGYLMTGWDPQALRDVITESLRAYPAVGAPATWVLSNHDVIRHATRLMLPPDQDDGIGPRSPRIPEHETGLHRARAATMLMLALPGSAYLYQGEELGLPEVVDIPDEARQDPTFARTQGRRYGRDGCRVPIPWTAGAPSAGFSETGETWLPQPEGWDVHARDVERADPGSTLNLYRRLLRERRARRLGRSVLVWIDDVGEDVLAFHNHDITVVVNFGEQPFPLPSGQVIAASGPLADAHLPTDTAVWIDSGGVPIGPETGGVPIVPSDIDDLVEKYGG